MNNHRLHNTVYAALETIAAAEKITRSALAELSRDLLVYVPDTNDIDVVNRLLGVLTPVNRRVAIAYFSHFLPFTVEKEADGMTFSRFGKKMQGEKKLKRHADAIADWMKDEANNIWLWSDQNIDVEVKQKNFAGMVQRQIAAALKGDEKSDTPPLSREELLNAIFLGGVTIDDMLIAIEERYKAQEQQEQPEVPAEEQQAAA